jgi:hypothetical protein
MANLRPERTGLPFVVFISQKGRPPRCPGQSCTRSKGQTIGNDHGGDPSVRVVSGALDHRDLALLTRWIDLNRDTLIKYWDGDIEYTEDAIAAIVPVGAS